MTPEITAKEADERYIAWLEARLAKVPALVEALRRIERPSGTNEWKTNVHRRRDIARDALTVWEQERHALEQERRP